MNIRYWFLQNLVISVSEADKTGKWTAQFLCFSMLKEMYRSATN